MNAYEFTLIITTDDTVKQSALEQFLIDLALADPEDDHDDAIADAIGYAGDMMRQIYSVKILRQESHG